MNGTVVILRPDPEATRTAKLVEAAGLTPVKLPIFKIAPVRWNAPDPSRYDGLLLTSTNGLRYSGPQSERFKALPVHAVGPVTAKYAQARGFSVATTGRGGVVGLLQQVPPNSKLLHLAGEHRLNHKVPQPRVDAITVYRSALLPNVDPSPIEDSVVLVHSPRAGSRLAKLAGDRKSKVVVVAISNQAAQACGEGWKAIHSVESPDERAMVALAAQLCDKPSKA